MNAEIPFGYIYQITNNVNGKTYVGLRKLARDKNWREYMGSGRLITAAIKKYGKDNFTKTLITYCYSPQELQEKEWEIIKKEVDKGKCEYNLFIGPGAGGLYWDLKDDAARRDIMNRTKATRMKRARAGKDYGEANRQINKEKAEQEMRKFSNLYEDLILKEYKNLQSAKKVADKLGISPVRTMKVLKANNIELNRRNVKGYKKTEAEKEKLRKASIRMHAKSEKVRAKKRIRKARKERRALENLKDLVNSCPTCENVNFKEEISVICQQCYLTWLRRKNAGARFGKTKFISCKNKKCKNGFRAKIWGTRYCGEECRKEAQPSYVKKNSITPTKELLTQLYVIEGKSTTEIAQILGCTQPSALNHLKKHGIPTRGRNGSPKRKEKAAKKDST